MLGRVGRKFCKPRVGVVGMGLMGHGIVQAAASAGYSVLALDSNQSAVESGMKRIVSSVDKLLVKKAVKAAGEDTPAVREKVAQQASAIIGNITPSSNTQDLEQCDLIVEAIIENLDIKRQFYQKLSGIVKPSAVLASNTSSFPIGELATAFGRGEQVCGLHFFNPVQLMKLVEVVRCDSTSDASFQTAWDFTKQIGKVPVATKDTPGFIVNRLLVPYIAQALLMLDRGDATPRDIDTAMMLGASMPMGPVHLADYVGLDTAQYILEGWAEMYPNEPAFVVPECLKEKVSAGKLGRKSGEGFYKWVGDKPEHLVK